MTGRRAALSAEWSTLHDVELDAPESVHLTSATVRGTVRGTVGILATSGAALGDVEVRSSAADGLVGDVFLTRTTVHGDLHTSGFRVYLATARIEGELRVVDARGSSSYDGPGNWAVKVCGSVVAGAARVARSHHLVAIGGHPDGTRWDCDATITAENRVGTLSIVDNLHSVNVARTTVDGDLRCYGNTGPRGVNGVRATVTGERLGQCADQIGTPDRGEDR